MTEPLVLARQRIIVAMLRASQPFSSQKQIAIAAGLITESARPNSSELRRGQRAVMRLVKGGVIRRSISTAKVDNVYALTPAGKAIASTLHGDAISRSHHADQPVAVAAAPR